MSTQKTVGKKNPDDAEIEEIMSEIEVLQNELRAPAPAADASKGGHLSVVGSKPAPQSGNEPLLSAQEEEDILKEFRAGATGGGDEGGLEDTLAGMKGEETPHGKSILDEAIEESETDADTDVDADAVEASHEESAAEEHSDDEEEAAMNYEEDENAMENNQDDNGESGTLSMTLTGNMTLKLKYATEGQEVSVGFGDGALTVKLADGTEFKIPVRRSSAQNQTKRLRKVG